MTTLPKPPIEQIIRRLERSPIEKVEEAYEQATDPAERAEIALLLGRDTPDLTAMTPPEIEALWEKAARRQQYALAEQVGTKRTIRRYGGEAHAPDYLIERLQDCRERIQHAEVALAPFQAEFKRRGGWTRYFVVSGGHLHKRECSTLRFDTQIGFIPAAAGMDAQEVVETFNYVACTHCFPDAPVEPELTLEQQGLCGNEPTEPQRRAAFDRYARGMRGAWGKCACGGTPQILRSGKFRKHKPGSPKH